MEPRGRVRARLPAARGRPRAEPGGAAATERGVLGKRLGQARRAQPPRGVSKLPPTSVGSPLAQHRGRTKGLGARPSTQWPFIKYVLADELRNGSREQLAQKPQVQAHSFPSASPTAF